MEIKTRFLETDRHALFGQVLQIQTDIDDLINGFLGENPDIEVIDIKYQSNVSVVDDATYYNDSALIIYKEEEE
ncbi:sporulation protein Cse60 [Streptococcus thermophilus]|nr:sporulation protein Cse60 [Streptococcus thermophilus]